MFTLPKGYSFENPSITIPGTYGGADISDHYDSTGAHFVLCDADGPGTPSFRLRAFRAAKGSTTYKEVELSVQPAGTVITGRGNCDIQWIDGKLHFSGWKDKAFFLGTIPSFVAFPSVLELQQRIVDLERIIGDMAGTLQSIQNALPPSITGGVLTVPAQGGIEGGEIVLEDGAGGEAIHLDQYDGRFRIHRAGVVLAEWG